MCLAYKIKLNICPNVFKESINCSAIKCIETRSEVHHVVNKEKCNDYLSYLITREWAKIPQVIKNLESYNAFKSSVKCWLIKKRVKVMQVCCNQVYIDEVIEDIANLYKTVK